jgi:hypothetical protein
VKAVQPVDCDRVYITGHSSVFDRTAQFLSNKWRSGLPRRLTLPYRPQRSVRCRLLLLRPCGEARFALPRWAGAGVPSFDAGLIEIQYVTPTWNDLDLIIDIPISFWASVADATVPYALTKGTYNRIQKLSKGGHCAALHTVQTLSHSDMALRLFRHLPMYRWLLAHCELLPLSESLGAH